MIFPLADPSDPGDNDLAVLAPLVAGKRVVLLGESSHGVREFGAFKARIVRRLHRTLGFNLLAFESPLINCAAAAARIGRAPAEELMRMAIYSVWHTHEVQALFATLEAAPDAAPLQLCGFDIQSFGAPLRDFDARLTPALARHRPDLAARFEQRPAIGPGLSLSDATALGALLQEVLQVVEQDAGLRDDVLVRRELASRIVHAASRAHLNQTDTALRIEGMALRDRAMADNLDHLLDLVHPRSRCIVWAHNAHISRQAQGGYRTMGQWLAERRDDVAVIGLYMGRGAAAANDRRIYPIDPPALHTLEGRLLARGHRVALADLRQTTPDSPWRRPMMSRSWGVYDVERVPAHAYDAVVVIDEVQPAMYA